MQKVRGGQHRRHRARGRGSRTTVGTMDNLVPPKPLDLQIQYINFFHPFTYFGPGSQHRDQDGSTDETHPEQREQMGVPCWSPADGRALLVASGSITLVAG